MTMAAQISVTLVRITLIRVTLVRVSEVAFNRVSATKTESNKTDQMYFHIHAARDTCPRHTLIGFRNETTQSTMEPLS